MQLLLGCTFLFLGGIERTGRLKTAGFAKTSVASFCAAKTAGFAQTGVTGFCEAKIR
ncbi:hypothetical protein L4G92_08790 [Neisseria sp. ZJ106]|uniref:Uncharacterized protein n=1 Tax=Neisseria lisongii TaxID=2912188 RepID=A0ABY7RH95_9NEIS|nr:hypothetical protein [Neisseria lisongii]MCF7522136.1 hypothetical protein [Neisseria lisongii]WCL70952.1 hypothetical protein PJU73_06200 [Neisseria lisongii]